MKTKIRHIYEIIAGAILSLLGLSGCEDVFYGPVEYGVPSAGFKLTGTVKSEVTGEPVKDIVVKFRNNVDGTRFHEVIETKTDGDGRVETSFTDWPIYNEVQITFEDVDGEENGGAFAPDTLRNKDLNIELKEDKKSGWFKGNYTIGFEAKLKVSKPE